VDAPKLFDLFAAYALGSAKTCTFHASDLLIDRLCGVAPLWWLWWCCASHAFVGLASPELRDYLLGASAFSIFSYDMPGTADTYLHRVIVTFPSYLRLVLLSLAIT
jgi:hypothetical protein